MNAEAKASDVIETTSQHIDASKVDWLKVDGSVRTFSKDKAQQLSFSLKNDGLLHPIVVRKSDTTPGRFLGIVGKHRWYGWHKVLKKDLIEARVVDVSEAQAELMRDAENLFRNALTTAQAAAATKRWYDAYDVEWKQYNAEVADRAAKKAAKKEAEEKASAEPAGPDPEPDAPSGEVQSGPGEPESAEPEAPEPVKPPVNFAKDVAAKTGKSEASVKRSLKIAKAFTETDLEVFDQMGVGQTWMETIAQIEQPMRDQVVALIASGRAVEESIGEVMKVSEVKRADGHTKDTAPKAEKEMTDAAWVEHYCGDVLGLLPHKAAFRADAALYRQIFEARALFKGKARPKAEEAKKAGAHAGLYALVMRICNLSHPKHWLRCSACQGHGVIPNEKDRCGKCFGAGYVVTTEKM